jgi:hypothetical protein
MKTRVRIFWSLLAAAGLFMLFACKSDDDDQTTVSTVLTVAERSDLLQLREEEKLARDVYQYSYEKYGLAISKNISNSEQTHMDQVLQILSNYKLADPASSVAGVFNNADLQTVYNQLIAKVDQSEAEALVVGATIEDLDIKDIEDFLQRTTKKDIIAMYNNLMCGSRNHLRSYYTQILARSGSYSPIYITRAEFDSIINSSNEQCGK